MRKYRLVVLLKSDLSKDARSKVLDTIKTWMGKIKSDKQTDLGEKKLAYSIKGQKSAEYVQLDFESEKISDGVEKRMEIQDAILRHLLVRMD